MDYPLLSEAELRSWGAGVSTASRLNALYAGQKRDFAWLAENAANLSEMKRKTLVVCGDNLIVQFNPHRMKSVSASLKKADIEKRPCFLCARNLPPEQKGIMVSENFAALCNPMPIFDRHFTLSCIQHRQQDIEGFLEEMLLIAADLGPEFVVFFNGAAAGASAPDHMHFQAAPSEDFPLLSKEIKPETPQVSFCGQSYPVVQAADYHAAALQVMNVLKKDAGGQGFQKDLCNLICLFRDGNWVVYVIRRRVHRPACYFAEGTEKLLISPACVELAGVFVTPREEDFNKITAISAHQILSEITES